MNFAGKFKAFFSDNTQMGNPEDPKLDMVVMFCMPTLDGRQHYSHMHVWTTTSLHVKYVANVIGENTYLDYGRNRVAMLAKEISVEQFGRLPDYYLWLDEDNVLPADTFKRLYLHNKDIVGGLYAKKTFWDWCLRPTKEYKDWENRRESIKDGLIKCDYIGFGGVLIKAPVFEKVKVPWFKQDTKWEKHDGKKMFHETGEDVYFCDKAREAGYDIWCDTKLELGHAGATVWPKDAYLMHKLKQKPGQTEYQEMIKAKDPIIEG